MASTYDLVYSEQAADFLLSLTRPRLQPLLYDLRKLADDPFIRPDYTVKDFTGRDIDHLHVSECVIAFYLDHAVSELRIVDIVDVS